MGLLSDMYGDFAFDDIPEFLAFMRGIGIGLSACRKGSDGSAP